MKCIAIIAIRNEMAYLPTLLEYLVSEGLSFAIIDNDSTDGSKEFCQSYIGRGCEGVFRLPFTGVFELAEQLAKKQEVMTQLQADWFIHQDADEILQAPYAQKRLCDAIAEVDARGFNCINFDEFVFLPDRYRHKRESNYLQASLDYYFYQPWPNRLVRAWKAGCGFSNLETGGHELSGDQVKCFSRSFNLRHYICLSQEHMFQKYLAKQFAKAELAKRWHFNRVGLTRQSLLFPKRECCAQLRYWRQRQFDKSDPWREHYWQKPSLQRRYPIRSNVDQVLGLVLNSIRS